MSDFVEVEDDFTSPLDSDEMDELRALWRNIFPKPPTIQSDGSSLVHLTHPCEEAAMLSVVLNRMVYGHTVSMEQVDGKWVTHIDVGTIEAIYEPGFIDPVRYVLRRPVR